MIPKVIHYCWFGHNPLPEIVKMCIESWKKFLPDYEIKEWNEENFDINILPYTKEAYEAKKYAFVSDYARFWILYHYGGVYFDTDVELIKPIDDILERGPFMACEKDCVKNLFYPSVNPGLVIATYANHPIYKDLLRNYDGLHFKNPDGSLNMTTIDQYTTDILITKGLKKVFDEIQEIQGIYIYPGPYFCPVSTVTKRLRITKETRGIHHYAATWNKGSSKDILTRFIRHCLPDSVLLWWNRYKRNKKIKRLKK